MDDEKELLEAVFAEDFQESVDPIDCQTTWRIKMADSDATVLFKLPPGYPDETPPKIALEFERWPKGADAFLSRMKAELMEKWQAGESCCYDWAQHVQEAVRDDPPELGGGGAGASSAPAGAAGTGEEADATEGAGVASVPIKERDAKVLMSAFVPAGFARCGNGLFSHGERGVTVEVSDLLTITVDGVDAEDLSDWSDMQLQADPAKLPANLLEWVSAQRSLEPGFAEGEHAEGDGGGLDFLPSPEELKVTKDRDLLIYTWGKALRKAAPGDSEHNFNAGILNGRGGGADLRTMNGLSDEVQNNVASCGLFPRWISMVCAKVEHSNCKVISINCTKGRHRSVAAAEILRKFYYPQAAVKHLTIY